MIIQKKELTLSEKDLTVIYDCLSMDKNDPQYKPETTIFITSKTFDDGRFVWLGLVAKEDGYAVRSILLHDVDTCSCEEIVTLEDRSEILGSYTFDYDDDVQSETCRYELTVSKRG